MNEQDAAIKSIIFRYHDRSAIDYESLYMNLYVSYNAWFRRVTGYSNDKEAIVALKKRFVLWDDYQNGRVLHGLDSIMTCLSLEINDWKVLIDYWYNVRCNLFHGEVSHYSQTDIQYAYESLKIFMDEIIVRMKRAFSEKDRQRLEEIRLLVKSESSHVESFRHIQSRLYSKYIRSPDIWDVDMVRVPIKPKLTSLRNVERPV
ncbi:MAG: hypothetical protein WAO28_00535 [Candidatus Microsaccharimonas sp.]